MVGARPLTMDELQATPGDQERLTAQRMDLMTVLESRLFDQYIRKKMVSTHMPVGGKAPGSSFGWRLDPLYRPIGPAYRP